MASRVTTGYLPVNDLTTYYESHAPSALSSHPPILVLHGALISSSQMGAFVTPLSTSRRVITFDFQGHGRTADHPSRPLRYELLASDAAVLLSTLGVTTVDVLGYSMGGGVAQHLTLQQPSLVRKLVVVSSSRSPEGIYPEMLSTIKSMNYSQLAGSELEEDYCAMAPDPQGFPGLVEKVAEMNRVMKPVPMEDGKRKTMLLVGDADTVRPEHVLEWFRELGGGVVGDAVGLPGVRLAVLPGTGHQGIIQRGRWIAEMVGEFLDEE